MPNLLSLRKRIKTVKNIAKVTKAMQVAASLKMKKAQEAALAGRIFTEKMAQVAGNVGQIEIERGNDSARKMILILAAPDRGLCGSLLTNLQKGVTALVSEVGKENISCVCLNDKSKKVANRLGLEIVGVFELSTAHPDQQKIRSVLSLIKLEMSERKADKCVIGFMHFVNLMHQEFSTTQLLPFETEASEQSKEYILEPDRYTVFESLLPRAMQMKLYQAILETAASEFSARAMAMKAASDNAFDVANFLSAQYNKYRQAAITAEIAEVVSGSMTQ